MTALGRPRASRHLRTWGLRRFLPIIVVGAVLCALWLWVHSLTLDSIEQRTLNFEYLQARIREHVVLATTASLLVAILAIPMGILIFRVPNAAFRAIVLTVANLGQAIPAVGVIILLAIVWHIGFATAIVALVAYAFLPVLRNTLTGLEQVDGSITEAARGMGLRPWQVLRRVQLPLASPVIMAGLRTSLVFAVGIATVATFINAGGLGDMIINGLKLQRFPVLLVGATLVAAIAVLIDWITGVVEDLVRPNGLSRPPAQTSLRKANGK